MATRRDHRSVTDGWRGRLDQSLGSLGLARRGRATAEQLPATRLTRQPPGDTVDALRQQQAQLNPRSDDAVAEPGEQAVGDEAQQLSGNQAEQQGAARYKRVERKQERSAAGREGAHGWPAHA